MPQNDGPLACPRCGDVDYYGDMRFWSAREPYVEALPDGTTAQFDMLCDDCHRDVVRT